MSGQLQETSAAARELTQSRTGPSQSAVAEAEMIRVAAFVAQQHQRSELEVRTELARVLDKKSVADGCEYSYPRGDSKVTGPSVKLARELARAYGNVRYGLRVLELTEDDVHVMGWAWDVQRNTYQSMEDRFARLIQRTKWEKGEKVSVWVKPDERDLRELVNRRGAICVRNALLQILPDDLVDWSLGQVRETLRREVRTELEEDREAMVARITGFFAQLGVPLEALEKHVGHSMETMTADEVLDLRAIYISVRDGNTKLHEHFELPGREGQKEGATADLQKAAQKAQEQQEDAGDDAPDYDALDARLKDVTNPVDLLRILREHDDDEWTSRVRARMEQLAPETTEHKETTE